MSASSTLKEIANFPNHVAVVPDGNGRWAERRGLPRFEGHRAGVENMHSVIGYFNKLQLKYLTLYTFSTENWKRPQEEITGLLHLLEEVIDNEILELHKKGVRLRHLGRLDELSPGLQQAINKAVELTKNNTGMTLSLAFNYGGRTEIL
ncbi:unnamed protein product, partial [marine sediment metagenome]